MVRASDKCQFVVDTLDRQGINWGLQKKKKNAKDNKKTL